MFRNFETAQNSEKTFRNDPSQPIFDRKHWLHFGNFSNFRYSSSVTWPISDLFRNARKKRRFVQKSIRTGRATATRRRRQEAARLAFHCAHRIAMRFCESPLRLVHGRRTSCVDRVPSASKKELSRPLEAVMDPTRAFYAVGAPVL
jgi:hypothetical protein